jgi:glucose-6-phosphate 1-dehydrogenase
MGLQVACTGMAQGTPPDPCVAVIFGASGDLAQNTLIPSLYALGCQGLLPNPFAIIGVARREWDDETFRDAASLVWTATTPALQNDRGLTSAGGEPCECT